MKNDDFSTLAYTKSPKTSRRTTFQIDEGTSRLPSEDRNDKVSRQREMMSLQDELQAAVSARASKTKTDQYSYSDDFDDDEDDFLNEFLKSRKKKAGAFKAGKSKTKSNDFDISDDDTSKLGRTKRVSFLKTKTITSPLGNTTASESREFEPPDVLGEHSDFKDSFSSQHSTNFSDNNTQFKTSSAESPNPQVTRESSNKSLSYQTSADSLLDMPLPLPSDNSVMGSQEAEEKSISVLEENSQNLQLSAADLKHTSSDSATEREPPRPKPRQRTLGLSLHATEKITEDADSQDLSRAQTSSASIPLSTGTSSHITWTEADQTVSYSLSRSSSSQQSQFLTKSTVDSGSRDGCISDDSKEQGRKYSTSFEEFNQDSGNQSDQLSHVNEKSFDTRTPSSQSKTTQRPHSVCSKRVESKYLGSLKVLDRKVSLQESQPQAADSLRAAIYQEWLKKKKEKSKDNIQLKKKEEILKEKKKKEEEAKKEESVASYEAWKEKKAESLRAKAKEKQDMIRKKQRETEEKEEKQQSAKQVFEKWKREHDRLLKEKHREQKETESKLKLIKQEKEAERKQESKSAFSNWCEKKKEVLHEKVSKELEEVKNKAEEERYMKEEKDKMALEIYENWLARKDLEQKRQREEKRIQAILRDSPPPPWSPPSKTIPNRR